MTTIRIETGGDSPEQIEWVNMLANMYYAWARRNQHGAVITLSHGPVAEIQTDAPIQAIDESGVFRLVRVSPYDPKQRRHTVFARVYVDGVADNVFDPRRSFVLDSYQLVSDHRTEAEYDNPLDVLAGNIEEIWSRAGTAE